jgi:hypothetical protein
MPLPFQPPPPPCVKCGARTVIAPVFEGQRVFVVQCPACRHAGTYSLDYDALPEWRGHGQLVPEAFPKEETQKRAL